MTAELRDLLSVMGGQWRVARPAWLAECPRWTPLCVPVRVHATAWLCCTLPPPCSSSDNEAPQAVGPLPGDICPLHIGARPHCLWAAMQMAFGVSSNKLPRGAPTIDKASIPRELILRASTARYQTGLSDDGVGGGFGG